MRRLLMFVLCFLVIPNLYAARLWVDDFDDGTNPNLLGGNNDYADYPSSRGSIGSYNSSNQFRGAYSYKFDYNVNTSAGQASYILFNASPAADVSGYSNLILWIKGASGGEHLHLYLEDNSSHYSLVDISDYVDISTNWQKVVIPMEVFKKNQDGSADMDFTQINDIKVSIEKYYGNDFTETSALYFDDIYFDDSYQLETMPVDNFEKSSTKPNGVNAKSAPAGFAPDVYDLTNAGSSFSHSGNGCFKFYYDDDGNDYFTLYLNNLNAEKMGLNYLNLYLKSSISITNFYIWVYSGTGSWVASSVNLTTGWQLCTINISSLADRTNIDHITFDAGVSTPAGSATVYIDDISFSKYSNADNIPSVPTGLTNSRSDGEIVIQWNANTEQDIQFYKIYRSATNTNSFGLIEMVHKNFTTFTDTNGIDNYTDYYYKITAVDCEYPANESGFSSTLSVPNYYSTITNTALYGQAGVSKNILWWNKINAGNLTGYRIYRSTTSGGGYTLIKEFTTTVTNYTDENVMNGTTYYYIVKGIDNHIPPVEGLPSNEVALTPYDANTYSGTEPFYLPTDENAVGFSKMMFNPEKESTIIGYNLLNTTKVKVKIYDLQGRLVLVIKDKSFSDKTTDRDFIEWKGKNFNNTKVASGVYVLIVESDNFQEMKKIVVVK